MAVAFAAPENVIRKNSVPAFFEKNLGQAPSAADFVARIDGYSVLIGSAQTTFRPLSALQSRPITMHLAGANRAAVAAGLELRSARSNYYLGSHPSTWITSVPQYARVRYAGVYPGIDLLYHGTSKSELEFDFIVAPGADAAAIRLDITGGQPRLGPAGELLLKDDTQGPLRFHRPIAYQRNGARRIQIPVHFRILGSGRVGFTVGQYDHGRELVIDPVVSYSTYLGGSRSDSPQDIAVDADGNAYVVGMTSSADFPITRGPRPPENSSGMVVTKLNSTGTDVVYSTYFPLGTPTEIAVDTSGNAYITGGAPPGFVTTPGAYNTFTAGSAFAMKLGSTGELVYSTALGTESVGYGIAVDSTGNAYISATVTRAGAEFAGAPVISGYIAVLNAGGSGLIASRSFNMSGTTLDGIALDASNQVTVVGSTTSPDFPVTANAYQRTLKGQWDVFVLRLNVSLTTIVYSTLLGSSGGDLAHGVAVDSAGSAYVVGSTSAADFPREGPPSPVRGALFVTRVSPSGDALLYSIRPGDSQRGIPADLALDGDGNAYTVFQTSSPQTISAGALPMASGDIWLQKVSASGTLVYSSPIGGYEAEMSPAVAVDQQKGVYITGWAQYGAFPVTADALRRLPADREGFVLRIEMNDTICSVILGASYIILPNYESAALIPVYAPPGCPWVASSSFARIYEGAGGVGDGYILLAVNYDSPPPGQTSGSLTVSGTTIAGRMLAWSQFTVTPMQAVYNSAGGSGKVNVSGVSEWSVHSLSPWITVTGTTFTSGNATQPVGFGSVSYSIAPNSGPPRTGGLYVAGEIVLIEQSAAPPPPPEPLRFVPVTPCRVVDTRNPTGPFGAPALAAAGTRTFNLPSGSCAIPATAKAYSLNVTVVPRGTLGFLTIWPAGQTRPLASLLNSWDGRVKANAAIVPAGINGGVSLFSTHLVDVILDVNGYFVPESDVTALEFYPMTPCRIADTRDPSGVFGGPAFSANQTRSFPVLASSCKVPAAARAYSLNFTVVPRGRLGYLSTWPTGQPMAGVSLLNSWSGSVLANAAIVPGGSGGAIEVFSTDATDVIVDINGYFAPTGVGGLSLYNVTPCRVLDTRDGAGRPALNGLRTTAVAGGTCGAPASASAYVLNATVLPQSIVGYLAMWPAATQQPIVSTLNSDGSLVSNLAIVPATNGSINVLSTHPTELLLDLSGYFAP